MTDPHTPVPAARRLLHLAPHLALNLALRLALRFALDLALRLALRLALLGACAAVWAAPPQAAHPGTPPAPQITSYMLLQEDLDTLFPKPAGQALHTMLAPLLHVDYPTAELLGHAMEARRCAHYALLYAHQYALQVARLAAAGSPAAPPDAKPPCPPRAASDAPPAIAAIAGQQPVAPTTAPPPPVADLLPEAAKRALLARAARPHLLARALAQAPAWPDKGCACTLPATDDLIYGLYPFWQTRPGQTTTPQPMHFKRFHRIGILGAQIGDSGELLTSGNFDAGTALFTRAARRFGTQVDLVVQRSEWAHWLSQPDTEATLNRAVAGTLALADTPLTDWGTQVLRHVLPFWHTPTHLFDGITLFFDNVPTDAVGQQRFGDFHRRFVAKLITAMQKSGRAYALNIVAPATLVGEPGAYGVEPLMAALRSAQKPSNPRVPEGADAAAYTGTTDITVSVLVLLHEPTSSTKRALRARVDFHRGLHGHGRVAFLNALLPVVFHAGAEPTALAQSVDAESLDADLAYFKWNYGGAGFWTLPIAGAAAGNAVGAALDKNFAAEPPDLRSRICLAMCPHRTAVRLVFMAVLALGLVACGLVVVSGAARRLAWRFARRHGVWCGLAGVCLSWLGGAAFSCGF